MKTNLDTSLQKLARTTNQEDYAKLYAEFQSDYKNYQTASDIVAKVKAYADNNDYKSAAKELGNFASGNYQISNPIISNLEIIKKLYSGASKTTEKVKPVFNKMNEVSKTSKGPLYFINNLSNYDRPEAQQFMNLSLDLPKATYSNNEFSMIQPIFNLKLNEYLHNIGTDLKVNNNMIGIVFDKTSSISRKLSNFRQLQKDIRANYNPNTQYIGGLGIDTDTNLQYTVGHFTVLNPRIENGIFKGIIFDKYDFDWLTLKDLRSIQG